VTSRLAFSPAARDDLHAAVDWYDTQRAGLGNEFLHSVELCLSRIEQLPGSFPERRNGVRSALLRRFPYAVLFRIRADGIEVLALWHWHRAPWGWLDRL
jgi:hypothetical protein